jgi:hypothetical protein
MSYMPQKNLLKLCAGFCLEKFSPSNKWAVHHPLEAPRHCVAFACGAPYRSFPFF